MEFLELRGLIKLIGVIFKVPFVNSRYLKVHVNRVFLVISSLSMNEWAC